MPFFRMRLILALIVGTTWFSVGSTYFDVLAHKLALRRELIRQTALLGTILQPEMEQGVASGNVDAINASLLRHHGRAKPPASPSITRGPARAAAGPNTVLQALTPGVIEKWANGAQRSPPSVTHELAMA